MIKKTIKYVIANSGFHQLPAFKSKLMILAYHRVLPSDDERYQLEQPGMCVTQQTLAKNMLWIQENFKIVRLVDWLRAESGTDKPGKYCAITLDDGWYDNFEYALPVFEKYQIPATLFCVPRMIDGGSNYWPGRLTELLQHCIEIQIKDYQYHSSFKWLKEVVDDSVQINWQSLSRGDMDIIIERCKQFSDNEIDKYIDAVIGSMSLEIESRREVLNKLEINAMLSSKLIDIGSHTTNHTRLSSVTSHMQLIKEIVDSQVRLADMFNRSVDLFCYPNGYAPSNAIDLVRKHYVGGCGLQRGWNTRGSNYANLRRINIHEAIASDKVEFMSRMSGLI